MYLSICSDVFEHFFLSLIKKKTMLERWIPLLSFSKKPLYLCLIVDMWRWGLLDYSVRSLGSTGKWYLYNTMRNWIAKKGRGVDISVRYFDNFCKKKKKKKRNKNRINPPSLKVLSKTIDLHLFSMGFYGWLVWRHFDLVYNGLNYHYDHLLIILMKFI